MEGELAKKEKENEGSSQKEEEEALNRGAIDGRKEMTRGEQITGRRQEASNGNERDREAEAEEVFLRMDAGTRVSRSARAEWILENLNRKFDFPPSPLSPSAEQSMAQRKGLSIFGVLPAGGRHSETVYRELQPSPSSASASSRFKVGPNTAVTFLADAYRIVFVLDLSPSCFAIDDHGCVLFSRLIQSLFKCLSSLASKILIPGAQSQFSPKMFVSVCAFSPFLCFPEDNVLLHDALLTADGPDESVGRLISQLKARLKHFIDRLVLFSQPHMREWSLGRRRARRGGGESVPVAAAQCPPTDRGFIQPEWALIFMLRMGLLGVQMIGGPAAARSLSSIVLISDGVCGVFDHRALQATIGQLRLNSVRCSFVLLRPASLRGPRLGHVGFPELFHFIATATLGTSLLDDQLDGQHGCRWLDPIQRILLTWAFLKRGLAGQLATANGGHPLPPLFGDSQLGQTRGDKQFSRSYDNADLAGLLSVRLREGFSLCQVIKLPLQPSAAVRVDGHHYQQQQQQLLQQGPQLRVRLELAWRPLVSVQYNISAPRWSLTKRGKIVVEVIVEAYQQPHTGMRTLLGDRHDPGSLSTFLLSLREADTLVLHLNSFNSVCTPKELDPLVALFEQKCVVANAAHDRLALTDRYQALRNTEFICFWHPLAAIDDGIWQKWMHSHTLRLVLALDYPLPDRLFTAQRKGRFGQCSAEMAFHELHSHLRKGWASLELVRGQSYVCLLDGRRGISFGDAVNNSSSNNDSKRLFFLIRTYVDSPSMLIRLCFPPSVSCQMRDQILAQFADSIGRLRTVRELQTLQLPTEKSGRNKEKTAAAGQKGGGGVVQTKMQEFSTAILLEKPLERVLIRYKTLPRDLHRIVRLEHSESVQEKRDMIVHNAITKFLCCRRHVWRLRGVFSKNAALSAQLWSVEFILQTLLRLRLNQGFHICWSRPGILNLVRQRQHSLEQFVIFGPSLSSEARAGETATTMKQRKSSLCAPGTGDEQMSSSSAHQQQQPDQPFGTLESGKSALGGGGGGGSWPQIVIELWTEPGGQQQIGPETAADQFRRALLNESKLLIHTLFTFDQLMAVCSTRLWVEKPFVLNASASGEKQPQQKEEAQGMETSVGSDLVQFLDGAFDLLLLLQNASQRELMLLPAIGYAEGDPHSLTRLSFLLKGLQQELTEYCDVCLELADESFFAGILTDLESCLAQHNKEKEGLRRKECQKKTAKTQSTKGGDKGRTRNNSEANPLAPNSLVLPLTRHLSLNQQQQHQKGAISIPNSPIPTKMTTGFVLPPAAGEDGENGGGGGGPMALSESNASRQKCVALSTSSLAMMDQQRLWFSTGDRSTSVPMLQEEANGPVKKAEEQQQAAGGGHQQQQQKGALPVHLDFFRKSAAAATVQPLSPSSKVIVAGSTKRNSVCGEQRLPFLEPAGEHSKDEPRKKVSAPEASNQQSMGSRQQQQPGSTRDWSSTQQSKAGGQPSPRALRVYGKRLNECRMVLFLVAKDARVCRAMMAPGMPEDTFPVLAFFCDKPMMAQQFSERNTAADGKTVSASQKNWVTENFGEKARLMSSSLAANRRRDQMQQQRKKDNRRSKSRVRRQSPAQLDSYFFSACVDTLFLINRKLDHDRFYYGDTPPNAGHANCHLRPFQLPERDIDYAYLTTLFMSPFDLADHCEKVFEEFIFTKAFISTVYTCLGQQLFIPAHVLSEAMDYRCEHSNIEIGSINDILGGHCVHVCQQKRKRRRRSPPPIGTDGATEQTGAEGRRLSRQTRIGLTISSSRKKRVRPLSSKSHSTNSISSQYSATDEPLSPIKKRARPLALCASIDRAIGEHDLLEMAKPAGSSRSAAPFLPPAPVDCHRPDFRLAFEQLLQRHHFHRVPGLPDFFFYWPQSQQDQSMSSFNLFGLEDFVQISLPTAFSPYLNQQPTAEPKCNNSFSRNSSARNTGKERHHERTRRPSVSAGSLAANRRRTTNNNNEALEEQQELGSLHSSAVGGSASWEQQEEELEDSEKSSLAGELLLCPERWPLFIQFSVTVHLPNGQMDTSPVPCIPSCLEPVLRRCFLPLLTGDELFQPDKMHVNVDMAILTWPLPSQCPFAEQQQEKDKSEQQKQQAATSAEEDRERARDLEELFAGSDGAEWFHSMRRQQQHCNSRRGDMAAQQCAGGDEEIFERKVEMLRQIPAEERRLLRRLQRSIQKMLKTEHVLTSSRTFDRQPELGNLLKVINFIREEADGGRRGAVKAASRGGHGGMVEQQTVARFEMHNKELVLVAEEAEDGLRRLADKLDGLWVEYSRLRQLPPPAEDQREEGDGEEDEGANRAEEAEAGNRANPPLFKNDDELDDQTMAEGGRSLFFYNCGVDDLEHFARTRHESIRQLGSSYRRVAMDEAEEQHPLIDSRDYFEKGNNDEDDEMHHHLVDGTESTTSAPEEEGQQEEGRKVVPVEEGREEAEDRDALWNSSTTADEGTVAELTMPLNDSSEFQAASSSLCWTLDDRPPPCVRRKKRREQRPFASGDKNTALLERKQLRHDFWLIVQVEQQQEGGEAMALNVYFCQRTFLLHDHLFEIACKLLDEQVKTVNQELLLERMHQTEECDQLLLDDHDLFAASSRSQQQFAGCLLDSASTAATRSAQNVPGEAALGRHSGHGQTNSKLAQQNRPSSLLLDSEHQQQQADGGRSAAAAVVVAHGRQQQRQAPQQHSSGRRVRKSSVTMSDEEDEKRHSETDLGTPDGVSELARYKFRPGYFACDMVWHCWFPIHPRLRTFGGANDIGFKALRLGLEGLAVRNRSNMYVYKERNGNVVYMRLHASEESVLANIPEHGPSWEDEVRQQCPSVLLAVHGVRPPGEEITVQLRSVLQRRLSQKTLEEIQNALLKNAHIRLEWCDIRFIQKEPDQPQVFFFTVPKMAQHFLGSVRYYLGQQMLTFCISPKFREQSGHQQQQHSGTAKGKFSGGSCRYVSGGGTSLALSLAGTPTTAVEHQAAVGNNGVRGGEREREQQQGHSFTPYTLPNAPGNPPNYVPTFYLVNKPPGEGKRDTGIACLEVKLIDWDGRLMEQPDEGRLDAESHSMLYPGIAAPVDLMQKVARMHDLSRCVQVDNPLCCNPVPGTCALFQFNMWQNGNVGVEELQGRLKMCVQQAVCDLVTEYGLLSTSLLEMAAAPAAIRSKTGSFSVGSLGGMDSPPSCSFLLQQQQQQQLVLRPSLSEVPIPQHLAACETPPLLTTGTAANSVAIGSSAPLHSPVKLLQQQTTVADSIPPIAHQPCAPVGHGQTMRHPSSLTMLARPQPCRQLQSPTFAAAAGANAQFMSQPQQTAAVTHQGAEPVQPQQQETTGELLRSDFVLVAEEWLSHVINETKGSPEMSHSVRKYQFRLDCDASARKIVQVVTQRLQTLLKTERVVICRSNVARGVRDQLQAVRSVNSLLYPVERDLGRVAVHQDDKSLDMAVLAFNVQLGGQQANLAKLAEAAQSSLSKFLPCLKPFIPRQRLLYMPVHGEAVTLFLYNYTNEVVAKAREIVERACLWHNARSRLLREIGLHKMGITHLSTLKSSDAKFNSYLLLTWMDPEMLACHDYPMDDLKTPDFSNLPRIYAQLLLKLYRFADPAFVAKHLVHSCPFEDQTQQMLLLREDVLSMLNDHLLYMEKHKCLREQPARSMTAEVLDRLVSRCHLVHFVQSPLLFSPNWRRKVGIIRAKGTFQQHQQETAGRKSCRKHSSALSVHHVQPTTSGKALAKPKSGQFPTGNLAGLAPPAATRQCLSSQLSSATTTSDEDTAAYMGRIQQMLMDEYLAYLCSLGLSLLTVEKPPVLEPQDHHPSSLPRLAHEQGGQPPSSSLLIRATAPEQWLFMAKEGGLLFVQLTFLAPYFTLQMYQWNASPQLDEHFRSSQQEQKELLSQEEEVHKLRQLERDKNELVRRLHMHSFAYDFHLRVLGLHFSGHLQQQQLGGGEGGQLLFDSGFNISAFLADFLHYYGCRPAHTRNAVCEEIVICSDLKVGHDIIWEHFLANQQHYGWKVVRMRCSGDGETTGHQQQQDEFMLLAVESRRAFQADYQLARVIVRQRHHQQQNANAIVLRLYMLLLLTNNIGPFEQPPESKSSSNDEQPQKEQLAEGSCPSLLVPAEEEGEFTQMAASSGGCSGEQISPCSTLIEQSEMENENSRGDAAELESFGEEEEDEEEEKGAPDSGWPRECRVVDQQQLDEEGIGASALSTLVAQRHHQRRRRQPSATSSSSSQLSSLSRQRHIFPPQLVAPQQQSSSVDYCYECVIAAAAELSRTEQQRQSAGSSKVGANKNKKGGTSTAAEDRRRRFCSGGVLPAAGRQTAAGGARMSLPPSRSSTTSSSSSQLNQQQREDLCRHKSDSSQLSVASSLLNSPAQTNANTLTPANSLKGLTEWRASNCQQKSEQQQQGTNNTKAAMQLLDCDWTLFEETGDNTVQQGGKAMAFQRNRQQMSGSRRHRKGQGEAQAAEGEGQGQSRPIGGREHGGLVPPEQVSHLHYQSRQQRKLQQLLEDQVRTDRQALAQLVAQADRVCHVDKLWTALLASQAFHIPAQKGHSLFLASSTKSDIFSEAGYFARHSLQQQALDSSPSSSAEQSLLDFEALLRVAGIQPMAQREPRLAQMLSGIAWSALCRFLVQFYDSERRCRYFESGQHSYLVITNPQFLDHSAALFRHNSQSAQTELFLLFKQCNRTLDSEPGSFATNSVHKMLAELLSCLATFLWSSMLHEPPTLG